MNKIYLSFSIVFFGLFDLAPKLATAKSLCAQVLDPKFEVEADFQKQFQSQIDEDTKYLRRLQKNPAATYLSHRQEVLEAERQWLASGKDNFAENRTEKRYRPILERIAGDLLQRQTRKFGNKHLQELQKLHQKALSLLSKGNPPYRATARFIMNEYLPLLDKILVERHPELAGQSYHRKNAEPLLEEFLNQSPSVYLHFSFEWVDDSFFIDTRPTLVNVIGINLAGLDDISTSPAFQKKNSEPNVPLADNFRMLISEFAWHDMGHAEFTALKDLQYYNKIEAKRKPLERVVWEWDSTRREVMSVVKVVKKRDSDLGDAMENLIFEIVRERGFQFSFSVLKQELETQKWVETIERKRLKGFYSHYPNNPARFARLEEARLGLLKTVERLKEQAQLDWIRATRTASNNDFSVPSVITYNPGLSFAKGFLVEIELQALDSVVIITRAEIANEVASEITKGSERSAGQVKLQSTVIRELVTAQVDPTRQSPLIGDVPAQVAKVLKMKQLGTYDISAVVILPSKKIVVRMSDKKEWPLSEFINRFSYEGDFEPLKAIQIFEINQVLGTAERNEQVAFTIRKPSQRIIGRIKLQQDPLTQFYTAVVTPYYGGPKVSYPLVELRIDPWVLGDSGLEK